MDDLCDSLDSLATWCGEQLHVGRVHPSFVSDSARCVDNQPNPGTPAGCLETHCFALRDARSTPDPGLAAR